MPEQIAGVIAELRIGSAGTMPFRNEREGGEQPGVRNTGAVRPYCGVKMAEVDFGGLYERHAPDVFRFVLYLTGHRADAEDITAETFARAWSARGAIRVGTVKAYLLMIARNLVRDRSRSPWRVDAIGDAIADAHAGPERTAEDREELQTVLAVLARLPEGDRSALLMRAVGGLSYAEIAAALGASTVAARVQVHRARVKLADLLGPTERGRRCS
jgi:RNA polymerase sigma-70 factor (ECF subfamily)